LTDEAPRPENQIPKETTPTWEMELLISGATVFGLLALPGKVDALFYMLFNRGSDDATALLLPLWLYAKVSLLTLIATFILHLILRGHWTAMVGLYSVYPQGIHARGQQLGPFEQRVLEGMPAMPARIEAADNRATRVFGVGFGMALVMVFPFALVLGCLFISLAASASGHRDAGQYAVAGAVLLVSVPLALALLVDRRLGKRLSPERWPGRALGGVISLYHRVGLMRGSNTLLSIFQSNEGRVRTGVLIFAIGASASVVTVGQLLADRGDLDYGDFAGLPDDDPTADDVVLPAHYASLRGADVYSPNPVPFIPDRVAKGPYLELFIPYRARQAAPALRQACPQQVEESAREGGASRPALDCLAALLDLRLDGAPQPVRLEASSDPATGTRGVLAMIPVQTLAPGRHLLTLKMPRVAGARERARLAADLQRGLPLQRIPFWK
jgi:hypothetical protein